MRFHTSLPVRSVARTEAFYSALFDEEPVKKKADYIKFLPRTGGLNLSFHQSDAEFEGLKKLHLGFEYADGEELTQVRDRLREAGLEPSERETSVCCYANQDKIWISDPDGYEWELYVFLEDTTKKIDTATGCCAAQETGAAAGDCC